jgi:flagellar biosynthesis chaperone FliJ
MKKAFGLVIIALAMAILIFLFIKSKTEEKQLMQQLSESQQKNLQLEEKIEKLEQEKKAFEAFFKNATKQQLRNASWNELKTFLQLDKTNELVYSLESFDCTGFAVELFKNARQLGINAGIAEIEFANEAVGHTLNAFYTDKGLIFIDVTGDENGSGKDKIAYIEIGKPYGVVFLEKAKDKIPDCNARCQKFIEGLNKIDADIFAYSYLEKLQSCKELLEKCIDEYNQEVEKFNAGKSRYSYEQMKAWQKNLEELRQEITEDGILIFSTSKIVKNLKIYF